MIKLFWNNTVQFLFRSALWVTLSIWPNMFLDGHKTSCKVLSVSVLISPILCSIVGKRNQWPRRPARAHGNDESVWGRRPGPLDGHPNRLGKTVGRVGTAGLELRSWLLWFGQRKRFSNYIRWHRFVVFFFSFSYFYGNVTCNDYVRLSYRNRREPLILAAIDTHRRTVIALE